MRQRCISRRGGLEFSTQGVYTVAHVSDLEKELFMPIKKELLDILACPACRGEIVHDTAKDTLNCTSCHRRYPIKDDIPVMLVDEATIPEEDEGQKKS